MASRRAGGLDSAIAETVRSVAKGTPSCLSVKLASAIGASATLKLNAEAARMRAAGDPVIHLGGGEPKSLAPDSAIDAGIAMLKTGEIRYTPGRRARRP